jgi:hypothetical protein
MAGLPEIWDIQSRENNKIWSVGENGVVVSGYICNMEIYEVYSVSSWTVDLKHRKAYLRH